MNGRNLQVPLMSVEEFSRVLSAISVGRRLGKAVGCESDTIEELSQTASSTHPLEMDTGPEFIAMPLQETGAQEVATGVAYIPPRITLGESIR